MVTVIVLIAGTFIIYSLGTMTSSACFDSEEAYGMVREGVRYFPSDYSDARSNFLAAAQAAGGVIESLQHTQTGPDGTPLFIDVAFFGAKENTRTLLIISGTHGVEGFAGSGIQTGILSEGIAENLPPDTSLVMIHGLNPYGMAHLRRFTEGNVDLNRNFVDHSSRHPQNPEYEAIADIVAPESISFWSEVGSWSRLLWYRMNQGERAVQAAVSRGQYSRPKGLFYGGASDTWSKNMLLSVVSDYLKPAKQVIAIDIHTGLGSYGSGAIIVNPAQEYQRAIEIWWRYSSWIFQGSMSPGTLRSALPETLPDAVTTAVTLEFGTYSAMYNFKALRAENWLHHHGGPDHPGTKEIKTCLLRAFYPDDSDWQASVWQQGRDVVTDAITYLGSGD